MGKLTNGITGEVKGRVANTSFYIRNGQNIVRSAHSITNTKSTPRRLAQREKIKVCNDFTRAFSGTGFFNKTFPAQNTGSTGYNRATAALMNLAITGTYPETKLNYKEVLISKGALPSPVSAASIADQESNIVFSWEDNSGNGTAKAHDLVILVAFFPDPGQAIFSIGNATRSDCFAQLNTKVLKGFTCETWIGFLSNDEINASNSSYCGKVKL